MAPTSYRWKWWNEKGVFARILARLTAEQSEGTTSMIDPETGPSAII